MRDEHAQRIKNCELQIQKIEDNINVYRNFAIGFITLGFILVIVFYCVLKNGIEPESKLLVNLGSISGGIVSSIFSLAGLFLVYVAFLGQKQQLLYQQIELIHNKIELELTRTEMHNQQLEMKKQNDTLEIQKFENLFFQLLNSYENTKKSFYIIMDKNRFNTFVNAIQNKIAGMHPEAEITVPNLSSSYYLAKTAHPDFELSFFFQIVSIVKFVFETTNEVIEKELYLDILKSSLSDAEKKCIYLVLTFDEDVNMSHKNFIIRSVICDQISTKSFCRNYNR